VLARRRRVTLAGRASPERARFGGGQRRCRERSRGRGAARRERRV